MNKELAKQIIEEYLKLHEPPVNDCVIYFEDCADICAWTYKGLLEIANS